MKITAEFLIEQFLRTYMKAFTSKEFCGILKNLGVKSTEEECIDYLEQSPYVFALADGTYITRAFAFTGEYFSFRPTRKEVEKGVFITGHRCMPFTDPEILSCHYNFFYHHKMLPKSIIEFDSRTAAGFFFLYGEEYSTQYIASDPANYDIDLAATDFELPSKVHITCNSLSPLIKDGFKFGDRIICNVIDWDTHAIEIDFVSHNSDLMQMEPDDFKREAWYKFLEKSLVESFDECGPQKSIEEQLALVIFDNRTELCIQECGSIEELFTRTKKITFEPYGVETRMWHAGQEVPAFGKWNLNHIQEIGEEVEDDDCIIETAPDYVVDAYLKDFISEQKPFDMEEMKIILHEIYPNFYIYSESQQKSMLLHLKNRHAILSSKYNRFAENDYAVIRHKAIDLYTAVIEIVYAIDLIGSDLSKYPQQPLVIFSQIYNHLIQIIKAIENEPQTLPKDLTEVSLSLCGMKENYDYILGDLKRIIEQQKKEGFVVTK